MLKLLARFTYVLDFSFAMLMNCKILTTAGVNPVQFCS